MLSVGEITRKNVLHYDHGICNFEPKSAFHLNISLFSCINVWIKLSNSSLAAIKLEYVKTFCCDPPSYTQVAGIRLGTGVKCSKVLTDKRLPSLDSWIDNLDIFMDFICFICQLCQFHDNSSVIIPAEPQYWRNNGRFHCPLPEPQSDHNNNGGRTTAGPVDNFRTPTPLTEDFRNWKMYDIKQVKICPEYRDLLSKPRLDLSHEDVIKWKRFPRYWPFVWGIPRSPVNSPHKGQWRGALIFSLTCA